jgi:hypothetical protein
MGDIFPNIHDSWITYLPSSSLRVVSHDDISREDLSLEVLNLKPYSTIPKKKKKKEM